MASSSEANRTGSRLLTNASGQIVWRARYEAFGKATVEPDADANGTPITLKIRFPEQYYDSETGLHYNYQRDVYEQKWGRYIQSDPIALYGGLNTYGYVGGNPVAYVDPWGLATCVYSIAEHSLSCASNDGKTVVTSEQGLHSGLGPCRNDPGCESSKNLGPVPSDTYYISANSLHGREGWWALQSQSWQLNIDGVLCRLGLKRCGFNIHLGTRSLGCITFDKNDPSTVADYRSLSDLFLADAPSNVLRVVQNRPRAAGPSRR